MASTPYRPDTRAFLWYTMSAMWLGIYLAVAAISNARDMVAPLSRIQLPLLSGLCAYLGARLPRPGEVVTYEVRARRVRRAVWFCFVLYFHLVLTFTLIDPGMGRNFLSFLHAGIEERADYIQGHINFTPLYTIRTIYWNGYRNGYISRANLMLNLAGNIFVFAPLAFFIPYLWRGKHPTLRFLVLTLAAVLSVELCQLVFMCGSCDIDDFILNFGGATATYLLLCLPPMRRLVARAFLCA